MGRPRSILSLALVAGLAPTFLGAEPATKRGGRAQADERREDRAVLEAQDDLEDARKAARDAERAADEAGRTHREALATRQSAAVAIQKTTDALEQEHAGTSGLTAARARWKELQDEKSSIPPEKLAELKKEAKERIDAAKEACERAVSRDPAMKKAQEAFEKVRAAEMLAGQKLEKAAASLATARTRLARAQHALAARKAADQRDTNKPQQDSPRKNPGRRD